MRPAVLPAGQAAYPLVAVWRPHRVGGVQAVVEQAGTELRQKQQNRENRYITRGLIFFFHVLFPDLVLLIWRNFSIIYI